MMFHGAEPRFVDPRSISFLATKSEMILLFNQTVKLFFKKTVLKTTFHETLQDLSERDKAFPKQLNAQIMVFNKNNVRPVPVRLR